MSIATRFTMTFAAVAGLAFSTAEAGQSMAAAEIEETFRGITLDGVYNDIKNEQGFAEACTQGLELGFDGKTLIHPSQVEPCNATFGPDERELEFAARVLEAWKEAEAEGKGVVTVDGRMVENLHVENARRLLAEAEAIARLEAATPA